MRVAINGCGIAGPALAWWLQRYGFEPHIFEKAEGPRSGGYLIDFWGGGYTIAEKMGLLPNLESKAHDVEEMRLVSESGDSKARLRLSRIREQLNGRFLSISRGDVAVALHEACPNIAITFGKSVAAVLRNDSEGLELKFSDQTTESFDLLIGADGLHSHVRHLAFGEVPETDMGACVVAFTAHDYEYRDERAYVLYQTDQKQMARTSLADGRTMFLLTFRANLIPDGTNLNADPRPLLREIYRGSGWESDAALNAMDRSEDIYFDRVSQIRLDHWSEERVALIGDAAACASLLAGEGTGLAFIESYVLAGELSSAGGDYRNAFLKYEERLGKFLRKKQDAARSMVAFFAPSGRWQRWLNRNLIRASALPGASYLMGLFLEDNVALPDYASDGPVVWDGAN